MRTNVPGRVNSALPSHRGVWYGGAWHDALSGRSAETWNPSTGESLGKVAVADAADIDAAVTAARRGFVEWRAVPPLERARCLRRIAELVRQHADELARHRDVAMVAIIGSVTAGRAVMRAASDTVKPLLLELGGKNALIAYPDADPAEVAAATIAGMNFTWCGQSCGSTSRAFVHSSI